MPGVEGGHPLASFVEVGHRRFPPNTLRGSQDVTVVVALATRTSAWVGRGHGEVKRYMEISLGQRRARTPEMPGLPQDGCIRLFARMRGGSARRPP